MTSSSSFSVVQSPNRSPAMIAKAKFCFAWSFASLVKTSRSSQFTFPITTLASISDRLRYAKVAPKTYILDAIF